MTNRLRIFIVAVTILVCVGADQVTKEIVNNHLHGKKAVYLAGGMVKLDYTVNKGAEFSFE